MSTKNVYLFKVVIRDTRTDTVVAVNRFKNLFQRVFNSKCIHNALKLTSEDETAMILDVIEDTEEYLFARLNRKRPNNGMQKRNYTDYSITDVLGPNEINNNGVELFTYCILGYSYGILSIVNSKEAPNQGALARIFSCYNDNFSLETEPIPNQGLINELLQGRTPEINKLQIDIAQPDAQIMQEVFGFNDDEVMEAVQQNVSSIVFEIKPTIRGALSNNRNIIERLIEAFRQNRTRYQSVILSGKANTGERQRSYDLYEKYFKYPISVSEYHQDNGHRVETEKAIILTEYKEQMMYVYDRYKQIILAVSNR